MLRLTQLADTTAAGEADLVAGVQPCRLSMVGQGLKMNRNFTWRLILLCLAEVCIRNHLCLDVEHLGQSLASGKHALPS